MYAAMVWYITVNADSGSSTWLNGVSKTNYIAYFLHILMDF